MVGQVDDARIYDRALTVAQIAALKPNHPSDPAPWAWWSFEDGKTEEHTGKFKDVACLDGARVRDGRLVLGGKGATLVAHRAEKGAESLGRP